MKEYEHFYLSPLKDDDLEFKHLIHGYKGSSTKEGATPNTIAKNRRKNKIGKQQRRYNRR